MSSYKTTLKQQLFSQSCFFFSFFKQLTGLKRLITHSQHLSLFLPLTPPPHHPRYFHPTHRPPSRNTRMMCFLRGLPRCPCFDVPGLTSRALPCFDFGWVSLVVMHLPVPLFSQMSRTQSQKTRSTHCSRLFNHCHRNETCE